MVEKTLTGMRRGGILFVMLAGSRGEVGLLLAVVVLAILVDADLQGADLNWVNLRQSILRGANLTGANLSKANLFKADLSAADLSGAKLNNASAIDTAFRNAKFVGADMSDGIFNFAPRSGTPISKKPACGGVIYGVRTFPAPT